MVPYLRVANVYENRIDLSDVKRMNFTPEEQEVYRLRPGDILLNEGQSPHLVGRPAMYRGELAPCYFQNTLVRFRAGPDVLPGWALLVFRTQMHARRYMRFATITTNIAHLGAERFSNVEFPVPPVAVQKSLVEALDRHESRLDAAVASLTRAKANVKRARASVLKAAVEGRLVPTEAALARAEGRDYEPASVLLARILAERKAAWAASGARGKYKEPLKPEGAEPAHLPEGWALATVDAVCLNIVDCPHSTPKRVPSGKLCARTTQFKSGFLDLSEPEFVTEATYRDRISRLKPEAGDILYSREGGILGIACPVPIGVELCLGQRMMLMRASASSHPRYLMLVLNSPLILWVVRRLTGGSAAPHINVRDIKAFGVPLPPLDEQHRIVAEVDRRLSVLDALDAMLDANLARCARLRQAVLKRAFEGRLVPSEGDAALLAPEPQTPPFAQDARS